MLKEGDAAPNDVNVFNQDNESTTLKDLAGKWIVLYFYPKDNTAGCTLEAKEFRDSYLSIKRLGAEIVGVSADTVRSHERFREKYDLPYPLWSDPERSLISAFDVWQKKKFMGREYMGIVRSTFLIDPKGIIRKIFPRVSPATHAEEVINALRTLNAKKR